MSNSFQGYDLVKFDRLATTTLADHIRVLEQEHLRNYAFPAQLQASGRVLKGLGGRGFDWVIQYKRHDLRASTGANVREWKPQNLYIKAQLPYRGYEATDSISRGEVLANRDSQAQIVNLMDGFLDRLTQSMEQNLARQYFNDGDTNTDYWHGFETFFGNNGTITSTTGAQRSKNAADIVAYPYATYAGLSTELSAQGGAQIDGIWPAGDSEPHRDFWTPLILFGDSTNAAVNNPSSPTTYTWQSQCLQILGYAITHSARLGGLDAQPTTVLMDRTMYNELKNQLRGKETIFVTRGNEDYSLVKLGFTNTLVVDGVECTADNSLPANTSYGFSYRNCELRCQTDDLFDTEGGVMYDRDVSAHKAVVSTISNLKFRSPRHFFKIVKNVSQLT